VLTLDAGGTLRCALGSMRQKGYSAKAFRAVPAVEQTITVCGWHKEETEAPCWQPKLNQF